jgi:hypothetical protein
MIVPTGQVPAADQADDQPYSTVLGIGTPITTAPKAVFSFARRCFIQGVVVSEIKG